MTVSDSLSLTLMGSDGISFAESLHSMFPHGPLWFGTQPQICPATADATQRLVVWCSSPLHSVQTILSCLILMKQLKRYDSFDSLESPLGVTIHKYPSGLKKKRGPPPVSHAHSFTVLKNNLGMVWRVEKSDVFICELTRITLWTLCSQVVPRTAEIQDGRLMVHIWVQFHPVPVYKSNQVRMKCWLKMNESMNQTINEWIKNQPLDVESCINPVFQGSDMNPFTAEENRLEWPLYNKDTFMIMSLTSTVLFIYFNKLNIVLELDLREAGLTFKRECFEWFLFFSCDVL